MIEALGYGVLALALFAVVYAFVKVLMYALDTINKNDD